MKEFIPPILKRVYRKIRMVVIYPRYRQYIVGVGPSHLLHGIPTRLIGDASADPTERLDHYDAFSFWIAQKITARGGKLKLLDVGSPKMMTGMLSAAHDVTSLVLADCGDRISNVKYIKHDVSEKLPFSDGTFDVCTSSACLPLVGLGRYGDRLDPDCLVNLVSELARVTKPDADLLLSMSLGKNVLHFNNGWFFDMQTIERIFGAWSLEDHLVDREAGPRSINLEPGDRFTKDTSVERMRMGDYRVIFLHFRPEARPPLAVV
jgi:SAM-dependent methyltransferase